jgi:prepilin-type N-terminal cleavage/methylation domain-containing protein
MKRYTKGFTLIELLVVIAIIGILASVVLVSLQSARKKGNDTRIISSVQQLRTALEADYNGSNYAGSFTPAGATYAFKAATPYTELLADISSNSFSSVSYGSAIDGAAASGLIVVTNAVAAGGSFTTPPTAYAIRGRLPSSGTTAAGATKVFCIDSTGKTNPSETEPTTGTNWAATCQ